jgi:2-dehydro-3-deoxy-D-arabinonate dehydratase
LILYRTADALFVEQEGKAYRLAETSLDALIAHDDLYRHLSSHIAKSSPTNELTHTKLEAPIGNQEVWASGVTYYSSRRARIAESKDAGGGDFYDRVYTAERPELFFKAVAHKVAGPNSQVKIRRDATWGSPAQVRDLMAMANGARR